VELNPQGINEDKGDEKSDGWWVYGEFKKNPSYGFS
jgi:hypothetical protein